MLALFQTEIEDRFYLSNDFIDSFADKTPPWGPVGEIVYLRTYSRKQVEGGGSAFRRVPPGEHERWHETIARVVEGTYQIQQAHCTIHNLPWSNYKAQESAQEMYTRMFYMKFLPPGRGLWMMGTDFIKERGSTALNNCAYVSTQEISITGLARPYAVMMDLLMLGVGVGYDTRGAGSILVSQPVPTTDTFVIPDSREGWCQALAWVLWAYQGGKLPIFDYSAIRPAGTPISGFGGVASGPEPLKEILEELIPSVLNPIIGQPITATALADIGNIIGRCVVAGNVRRSAEIILSPETEEFLNLKEPDQAGDKLIGDQSYRWASNNSVMAEVGSDYSRIADKIVRNGEPGLVWLKTIKAFGRLLDPCDWRDYRAIGVNPCSEQSLEHFELCTLVESFPVAHEDYEDYLRTLKYAYLYAKTVTLVPTHIREVNQVMLRNRRIGLSQSGIVQNYVKHSRRTHYNWCDRGYKAVKELDKVYSSWLAVPESIKLTSVKPSGTVSKLGGYTCGMHRAPAEYYIQRIRFAEDSPFIPALRKAGYNIEQDLYSPKSCVVEFPIHEKYFSEGEEDVPAAVQLAEAAQLQKYWADNQVSCTVKFNQETEGPHLTALLELFEDQLKGISFLPYVKGRPIWAQAPWEPISQERYMEMTSKLRPLEFSGAHEKTEKFCDGDKCDILS